MASLGNFILAQISWFLREMFKEQQKRQRMTQAQAPRVIGDPQITYYIYSLQDAGEVFYVGPTDDPLNKLSWHISESKKQHTPLQVYIHSMLKSGRSPDLIILHKTTNKDEALNVGESFIKLYEATNTLYWD